MPYRGITQKTVKPPPQPIRPQQVSNGIDFAVINELNRRISPPPRPSVRWKYQPGTGRDYGGVKPNTTYSTYLPIWKPPHMPGSGAHQQPQQPVTPPATVPRSENYYRYKYGQYENAQSMVRVGSSPQFKPNVLSNALGMQNYGNTTMGWLYRLYTNNIYGTRYRR
jgi:hypothetical protein